ncbi:NADP-dependent oxidoreductase [Corallincola platygyrae]|uniref:NADP-dependent oxidoreductase n=1 Tax=Corallincola platygyrae TaxID=1193278 RepID=A0ABW4XMY2_9GAMM
MSVTDQSQTTSTTALNNRRWIYSTRPAAEVSVNNYRLEEQALDTELANNEVLIANRYISVDPYMRIQQSAKNNWEAPHPLNTLQQAGVVAQVVSSRSELFRPGDWVTAYTGWELFSKVHQNALLKLDPAMAPVTTALGVLGMPGRTAWFGFNDAGKPKPGDTVVVSGAAGAVGSLVVQFAKLAGCRVIGICGSNDKCDWLTKELGADAAINYREHSTTDALQSKLAEFSGVDIYFDNIGGWITDAVVPLINRRARIVICGQMSQYNGQLDQPELGPRLLHHMLYQRATIQGILARDFNHRMDEMVGQVAPWVADGSIKFEQTVVEGFENLPETLAGLLSSRNRGKVLVKVSEAV